MTAVSTLRTVVWIAIVAGCGPADSSPPNSARDTDPPDVSDDVAPDTTDANRDAGDATDADVPTDTGPAECSLLPSGGFEVAASPEDSAPPGWGLAYPGGASVPGEDGQWALDMDVHAEGLQSLRIQGQPGRNFLLYRTLYVYSPVEGDSVGVHVAAALRYSGLADPSAAGVRVIAQEIGGDTNLGYLELKAEGDGGTWTRYTADAVLPASSALLHILLGVEETSGGGDLWIDDLHLSSDPCATPRDCVLVDPVTTQISRLDSIPPEARKFDPADDPAPPVLHLPDEYHDPVPLTGPINTAGAEDAFFISDDDDNTAWFYFTPSFLIPPSLQVQSPEEGVYSVTRHRVGDAWEWDEPQKVWLFDTVAGEGCPWVGGGTMIACAAACGYTGLLHFMSTFQDGLWTPATLAPTPFNDPAYEIGEYHLNTDENGVRWIYYHSERPGGQGDLDLWVTGERDGAWGAPVNLGAPVNSAEDEGFPYLTPDGRELWFTAISRDPDYYPYFGIFRAKRGDWDEVREIWSWDDPEEVVTRYAGEPTLDADRNLYFTHHYYYINPDDPDASGLVESDIYVARRR